MAINYPGPYELRVRYTSVTGAVSNEHTFRISMAMNVAGDPGDPFTEFTCQSRTGATPELEVFTDNLVALVAPLLNSNSDINDAELWLYEEGTFNAQFISTYAINEPGTSGTSTVLDSQSIITFRSQLGGSARFDIREGIFSPGAKVGIAAAPAAIIALADFLTDVDSPMRARDNGYVFTALNWLPGSNERLFKKRFR